VLFVFDQRALRNAYQDPETAAKLAAVRIGFGLAPKHDFAGVSSWRRPALCYRLRAFLMIITLQIYCVSIPMRVRISQFHG
jgi:hypothetical protein